MYKKIIIVLLSLFILSAVIACGESKEVTHGKIDNIMDQIEDPDEKDKEYYDTLLKYSTDDYFNDVLLSKITKLLENEDYQTLMYVIFNCQKAGYMHEDVSKMVSKSIKEKAELHASSNSVNEFVGYLWRAGVYTYMYLLEEGTSLGTTIMDFTRKNGTRIITKDGQGGYYDDKHDRYTDNHGLWYSPLFHEYSKEGYVGTYRDIREYKFYGDILYTRWGTEWWSTDGYNGASEINDNYRYREEWDIPDEYVNDILNNESYYLTPEDNEYSMYFVSASSDEVFVLFGDRVLMYER